MKNLTILVLLTLAACQVKAQDTTRKVWVSGAARGVIYGDDYSLQSGTDSITPSKLNSGHTMVDLTANIKPNSQTYVNAMVRVRNDYGGFWGGGVTFDMRQLYVKGVLANVVRYQLGDLDYKLTPYTFYNNEELAFTMPATFDVYQNMMHYDLFYQDENTWRQQGAAADFALEFSKVLKEMQFNFFATRQNPTDFNFTSERLFYGGNVTLLQGKYFDAGVNYVEMMDVAGTSNDTTSFHSPVTSVNAALHLPMEKWNLDVKTEFGNSAVFIDKDTSFGRQEDYFYDISGRFEYKPLALYAEVSYRDVGPKFRSPGAQSLRINYDGDPAGFQRYSKDQVLRPVSMIDLLRDASLYNYRLSGNLQNFLPRFGNAQPYGVATPNRKGYTLTVGQKDYNKYWDVEASYQNLSEIVGQGTTSLRSYQTTRLNAELHAASFFAGYNRNLNLEFNYWNESTTRSGEESFENIDFNNTSYSVGLEVETINNLNLIWGFTSLESSGTEFYSLRALDGEIVDFSEYTANVSETLMALGLRFDFSETSQLQFNWQQAKWNDQDKNLPDYQFNQFALMYNLKF